MPGDENWTNGYMTLGVIGHEIGHNLGVHHASTLDCRNASNGRTPVTSRTADDCSASEYGDPFSIMGNGTAGHHAWHRAQLGYPIGTQTVSITAGLDIHRQIGKGAKIKAVRIVSPLMKYTDRPQPATGLDGKFSLQYTGGAAILDGKVGIDTFTDARRFSADMVDLLGKITLTQDASIPGDFHKMHVAIEADLEDGRTVKAICHGPQGA